VCSSFPYVHWKIRISVCLSARMLCYAVCVHTVIAQIALCQLNVAAGPFHTWHFFVDPPPPLTKNKKCCVGSYKTRLQINNDNIEQMSNREVSWPSNLLGNNDHISYIRKMNLKVTPRCSVRWSVATWYDMIYDMIWYMIWYDIWYDMIYDMVYDTIYDIYGMIYDIYDMMYDMIWYDIWYDMIYDMIYDTIWYMIWYMIRYDIWYDMLYDTIWYIWYMIRYMIYMIWYDMVWYDMIWYDIFNITAVGLSPGGSTHLHTNNNRTTQITTNMEECGPCTVFASFTLAFALQLRKKHRKTSVRVRKTSVRLRKTSVRVQYTNY